MQNNGEENNRVISDTPVERGNAFSRIMLIGDVIGKPGRRVLNQILQELVEEYSVDFVIANGENAAAGFGLSRKIRNELVNAGVDAITGGNHIWDRREIREFIDDDPAIIRPFNYPSDVPGQGYAVFTMHNGIKIGVLNLLGRVFNIAVDCPFRLALRAVDYIRSTGAKIIIVDFHGEATSEKKAIGWFLDGKVSAVLGTHTHVQTADEKILLRGTAYITDVGMTGPANSIIGVRPEIILKRLE
jgi:metallophosphoesterase (TIGR00282 family)